MDGQNLIIAMGTGKNIFKKQDAGHIAKNPLVKNVDITAALGRRHRSVL